ncbi:hypothetical protein NE237_012138 [Protea cynaroides]|uniref:Uncharacterized protein n=1 Tax=Protea cynaroides TaxID=273540 RepID=A0A9Q0JYJ3_9MAGN|nr:hypothetical protein NE237_012138 [Protea cynaroides]
MRIRKCAQRSQTSCLPTQLPSSNCQRESPSTLVCELNRRLDLDKMFRTFMQAMTDDDRGGEETSSEVESFMYCNKTDGKGWKCKKEAKQGQTLTSISRKTTYYLSGRERKSNGKTCSSKMSSFNYFYYTGFGPEWSGKDRIQSKRRFMKLESSKVRKPVKTRSLKSLL